MFERLRALQEVLDGFDAIDLSHTIENDMPRCLNHPHVAITKTCTHEHDGFYNQCLVMGEHTGTHVDAPAHTVSRLSESTIDTYPVTMICGQAVKYDLCRYGLKPGETAGVEEILALESEMGTAVGAGEIAILNFGWEKYWRTDGDWKYFVANEPGLSREAARLFLDRGVKAVGCDTTSCDMPIRDGVELESYGHFEYWLPNGIFLIEVLKNLALLPDRFYFVAAPLKIREGSGSPIRPFALVPRTGASEE
ncbi:MAG: cyclase family protein [Clostridia bacterium]|nr:cyclase family protein [Clostridia bacterium]